MRFPSFVQWSRVDWSTVLAKTRFQSVSKAIIRHILIRARALLVKWPPNCRSLQGKKICAADPEQSHRDKSMQSRMENKETRLQVLKDKCVFVTDPEREHIVFVLCRAASKTGTPSCRTSSVSSKTRTSAYRIWKLSFLSWLMPTRNKPSRSSGRLRSSRLKRAFAVLFRSCMGQSAWTHRESLMTQLS